MVELGEVVFEMMGKKMARFVVEQCHIVEHACTRTETGLGGSNRGQKDLVAVWVQQVEG
jgi:hypothetical protein